MKRTLWNTALLGGFTLWTVAAEDPAKLSIQRNNAGLQLSWPSVVKSADGQTVHPYFEIQRSLDLRLWEPIDQRRPRQHLGVTLGTDQPYAFYHFLSIQPPNVAKLSEDGAEVLGYAGAFAQELARIGQISPDQFAAMFPNGAKYLDRISWDPTTAQFWDQFSVNPEVANQGKSSDDPGYRSFDARLNPAELALFKINGFVVTGRLGASSFAEVFYNLWHNDLPVFISCDSILGAGTEFKDVEVGALEHRFYRAVSH